MIARMMLCLSFVLLMLINSVDVAVADEKSDEKAKSETSATPVGDDAEGNPEGNKAASTQQEKPAPYILKIIKSGEAKPRSANASDEGKQDNRRVDVTLTRKVPVDSVKKETRRALFGSGGAVWVSKDPTSLDRILEVKAPASVSLSEDQLKEPVAFDVKTNYPAFIQKLELLIWTFDATQLTKPIYATTLDKVVGEQRFEWDGQADDLNIEPGTTLLYAIRASDAQGRYDESTRRKIQFIKADSNAAQEKPLPEISVLENLENTLGEYVELERESIPLSGSKVRLFGQDFNQDSQVFINEQAVTLGDDGRFGIEYLLPEGEHRFDVVVRDSEEQEFKKQLNVSLDNDYFFMVGLADLTVGENKVSGSVEPLAADEHHYGGDIFVDGRLAFYLKGKVRGKYLVTAQMDTGTEDIENLFDDFHRKDPNSVFRRLDPDQYYPVYGDDSILIDDTDSQGKLYVRVDWDRSRLIWGNYNTNFTGTEFAPFNRSLYGAQLRHDSTVDTSLGDAKHSVNAFASKAQSLFRHNEFLGTGGSLYYLRDTDIVAGSEKVWVEVRQAGTSRVVNRVPLVAGRDYDIDDFQGRLILRRPLLSVAAEGGPSIIRDEPLDGNQTYLIVDYEYSPQNLDFNESSAGVRAKKWLGNNVGVGGTWVYEQREGDDYEIRAADITLKKSNETFVKTEVAQSTSSQTSGSFLSTDGGLSFEPFVSNNAQSTGNAFGIEARVSLLDFSPDSRPVELGGWARRQQAGFSTANTDTGVHTTDLGIEAVARPFDKIALQARASRLEKRNLSTESSIAAQADYAYSDRVGLSTEVKNSREENLVNSTNGESTLLAGKISVDVTPKINIYGINQLTLQHSGTQTRNNSATVGATVEASNSVNVRGEVSMGDRGSSALLGTEVNVSDTYSVYTNYTYSFSESQVEKNSFVLGQRKTLSSQLKVYSEHQFTDEDSRTGFAHTVGLDQKLTEYTSFSLSGQRAVVENENGENTERNTVSAGLAYQKDKARFNSKLEYRWDESASVDTEQWVTTNRFEYRNSPSFRWQGKFNAAITDDKLADEDARFIEAGIGFALRPVSDDRLNMLARITYLNDLQPLSQSTSTDQRSLITSIEGLYDLSHRWSVGSKLAHRESEIRLERNTGVWIGNDASLVSARLRYKATFGIDATAAYHWLYSGSTDGLRQGALLTVGRRVGDNLTFSVGYNFTSFDDNLANDSFDVKGWFVNLVGTY